MSAERFAQEPGPSRSAARFLSLWAINSHLDPEETRSQLDGFRSAGLDGVVVHPRHYPGRPPYLSPAWFEAVSSLVVEAKTRGLAVWIYDENGWPSGTADGLMLETYPDAAQQWLEYVPTDELPRGLPSVARHTLGGRSFSAVIRHGSGVDYLGPHTGHRFRDLTYEAYRKGLTAEAWDHVEAFFDDEPEFGLGHAYERLRGGGAVPWTTDLPARFEERFKRPLEPSLPGLFQPAPDAEQVRIEFWELVSDLFSTRFLHPLNEWCSMHGKRFTAHLKGEENPHFQVPMVGSSQTVLRAVGLPGVDALERHPSNEFYPRQASSVARQFGEGRAMAEVFGGAGWGAGPADLERSLLWLSRAGLTDFVVHLSQYRLDSSALADWPPSQPLHLTWAPAYATVLERVRARIAVDESALPSVLVVIPQRRVMSLFEAWELSSTNIHNASTQPHTPAVRVSQDLVDLTNRLVAEGIRFDLTDERTLESELQVEPGAIRIGQSRYRTVVLSPDVLLDPATRARVAPFARTEEQLPIRVAPVRPITVRSSQSSVVAARWSVGPDQENHLLLEVGELDGQWRADLLIDRPVSGDLELQFSETISMACINGTALQLEHYHDGTRAKLPATLLRSNSEIVFRLHRDGTEHSPVVWLRGRFRVASRAEWVITATGQLQTAGPFALDGAVEGEVQDLVLDGFPFLGSPLIAQTSCVVDELSEFGLERVDVPAARLRIGDRTSGWTWAGSGTQWLISEQRVSQQRIFLEVLPNGFNHYGPHHYFLGDYHVISPDQVAGHKNFADPVDAPRRTHIEAFSFRRSLIPDLVARPVALTREQAGHRAQVPSHGERVGER